MIHKRITRSLPFSACFENVTNVACDTSNVSIVLKPAVSTENNIRTSNVAHIDSSHAQQTIET